MIKFSWWRSTKKNYSETLLQVKVSRKKKVCSRFKVIDLLCIAHFFWKQKWQEALVKFVNLREKVFSRKFASWVDEVFFFFFKKNKSPSQWIGNKGIFHVSLISYFFFFERIIQKQVSSCINDFLSLYLCGYRKGFSAILFSFTYWKMEETLINKDYTGVVLMDFSKAFDIINHEL